MTIAPCTVDASTGVITVGTVADLAGTLDELNQDYSSRLEEISALDIAIDNNVIISRQTSFRIREIMQSVTPGSKLGDITNSADIFQIVVTRASKTYTYYGVLASYSEPMVKGKHVAEAVFAQIGLTTANPAYA